ncbi:MAG: substrate-binding domain-containing protein, partial [Pseudomonadota bacterium]
VVGFDGVPEAAYADPPLSTIAQPAEEKGVAAVEMLLGARPMTNLLLDAQPIVRGSIAPRSD